MKKLWDISPPLDADRPAFPGDTHYVQLWPASLMPDCPVNMSADASPVRAVLREL